MTAFQILLVALGAAFLYLAVKAVRGYLRFKRSFDDFAEGAGERLLHHAEQVDSTLERWHEYDEAYQEAVSKLEEEDERREQLRRGLTLGPTGDPTRKPN